MKFTLALLLTITGMHVALSDKSNKTENGTITRQAYYANLYQIALQLSMKVFETKENLEEKLSDGLKIRHDMIYRRTGTVFHPKGQNETEKLNWQFNEVKSFLHRIKMAKSVERNIKGKNLLFDLTSIELKVKDLKMILRCFMKHLHIKIVKNVQPTVSTVKKNKRLQTLTTLKNLQKYLAFMKTEYGRAKDN